MGLIKEGIYATVGITVGIGANEILKGAEMAAPGSSQTITEVLKTIPVLTPMISWGGIRLVGEIARLISGNRPPTSPLRSDATDYSGYEELTEEAAKNDSIWGGRQAS